MTSLLPFSAGPISLTTGLPPGTFFLRKMRGTEALGRPFVYDLELQSQNETMALTDLVGGSLTVGLELGGGQSRYFNGIVTDVSLVEVGDAFAVYHARVQPWLWLLTRAANCRIFQDQAVPEIVELIFREYGFTDFQEQLSDTYPKTEFTVQYRETDFQFVSRLLEDSGIYYYFVHESDKHTLVLCDSPSAHEKADDTEELPFRPPDDHQGAVQEHVSTWRLTRAIASGATAALDFDFTRPLAEMNANASAPESHPFSDFEVFDYPGKYSDADQGAARVRIRLEELKAAQEEAHAQTNARGLCVGNLFDLVDHPRDDQNREYLVTSASFALRTHELQSGAAGAADDEEVFTCKFTALASSRPFRPARRTPKPRVEGPQTAIVVGQSDEEIWTDEHGRVKLQFHWDREGLSDERSSCWVRVSQAWAGAHWGAMHIPRIGQEVIVDFLEGDPDRPIVTGRVYNGQNKPPYDLPTNRTQSGIQSRSTKGGTAENFNEIRFEDKKGEEQLFVQAEKDHDVVVKNDQSVHVGANQTISVEGDRSVSITGNESVTVSGKGKGAIHSSLSVTGKHKLHASDTIDADAPTHIKLECGGSSILIEPNKITLVAGGGATIVLDPNVFALASGGGQILVDANLAGQSKNGGKMVVDANVLAESQGGSKVVLDGDAKVSTSGAAEIHGATATIEGDSQATVSAGGGKVDVAGGMVKINS